MASRVPVKDSLFDQYIRNTTAVLETTTGTPPVTGAVRLDLTSAQNTQWLAYRDQWIVLYPKYTNPATRTTSITASKNQLKKDFTAFAVKPLLRIESSDNLTDDDRSTFNLPKPDTSPTQRGAITDIPFGKLTNKGGGMLEIRARREQDATRSSIHPLADAVEFKYAIVDNPGSSDTTPPTPEGTTPGIKSKGMPTADDCPNSIMSKTALWRINLGSANQGKRIIGFLRWVNLTNPANNSGWSDIMTVLIL